MKITICDDSIEDLIKIEKFIRKYETSRSYTGLQIDKFSDASKLYNKISKKELADIYILDMIMPEITGIDLGGQIRKHGSENVIIYITSSDDFALDAYHVHAVRYLLKPIREDLLFEALDYAMSYTKVKQGPSFLIKTKKGLVSIPYSKIEYIENTSRILDIHLTDGDNIKSIFIRKSFDEEIRELLNNDNFMQVHKSFLINLKYVKKLTQNNVIMEGGKDIPVSKSRAAGVKKEYLVFVSEQYK